VPADPVHAALASEYAHVTAPLRRLGDRYAGEICVALCAGTEVPGWVLEKLHVVPETMKESGRRAHQYESAVLDLVEAGLLQHRVGDTFDGVIVDLDHRDDHTGTVIVQEPAIEARVSGPEALPLGTDVRVRLAQADVASRAVGFTLEHPSA
jgi:exoribonuclease R